MSKEYLDQRHIASQETSEHPVVQLMLERLANSYNRANSKDNNQLALAIEGGGIAGAVSAGMCVVLESTGLIDTLDVIYGTSSGALNGAYTASKQAALGSTIYKDVMSPVFYQSRRLPKAIIGKPVINFDYLFIDIIMKNKPLDSEAFSKGPSFRTVAVNYETFEEETLKDFSDVDDLMLAIRASCAIPKLSGQPVKYKGVQMTDGALLHSVPFRTAIVEGMTQVLALRSRGEEYRKKPYTYNQVTLLRRFIGSELAEKIIARPELYNEEASILQKGFKNIYQLALQGKAEPIKRLEKEINNLYIGFKLGVLSAAKVFGLPNLEVEWDKIPKIKIT